MAAAEHDTPPYPYFETLFRDYESSFADFIGEIDSYADALSKIGENRPPQPRWDQVWFPRLDGCAAYTLVRTRQPSRIVEIGSGHSTRFLARAIRDGTLQTKLISIDPSPRAVLDGLAITRVATMVQAADPTAFAQLGAGDVLFIDGSHILAPGSDVDYLINSVLPALPAGLYIHFHDVFLPDAYPEIWQDRRYNEQSVVAALLQGGDYEVIFASHYVASRMADAIANTVIARLPLRPEAFENSLWLVKRD